MKIIFLGIKEECIGFSLCGIDTLEVNDFKKDFKEIIKDKDVGLIIITDRYYEIFKENFSHFSKKKAVPSIVFVPSFEKTYLNENIKRYLSNVLGIRL
jgi:V/A-type H+-transporting ATPase subunit F